MLSIDWYSLRIKLVAQGRLSDGALALKYSSEQEILSVKPSFSIDQCVFVGNRRSPALPFRTFPRMYLFWKTFAVIKNVSKSEMFCTQRFLDLFLSLYLTSGLLVLRNAFASNYCLYLNMVLLFSTLCFIRKNGFSSFLACKWHINLETVFR